MGIFNWLLRTKPIVIYERLTEHWPVLPAQAAGNSCASGHCKHNGATCCTKAKHSYLLV